MSQPEDEANRTTERVTQRESQSLNSSTDPPIKPGPSQNTPGQFSHVRQ